MWKRWMSCGLLAGLLLLCMGGWIWSSSQELRVVYNHTNFSVGLGTMWGSIYVAWGASNPAKPYPPGWWCNIISRTPGYFWPPGYPYSIFLGFYFYSTKSVHFIKIPYWFFIFIFAFTLFHVWRKASKRKQQTGFPVEVKEEGEKVKGV